VVQNIVFTLTDYGVPEDQILGIRYGLRGFYEREDKPITLTRDTVDGIHLKGGTMLVSWGQCSSGVCGRAGQGSVIMGALAC
jgi:6-phosphofructokinase